MKKESPLKILFVEDLPTDVELAKKNLLKKGLNFIDRVVEDETTFLQALEEFVPDIIISDYKMPQFDGMRALHLALEKYPDIPFIILTGSMNEEIAVECMKTGATDYVIKEHITRLSFSVLEAIEQKKLAFEKKKMEQELHASEERFRSLYENVTIGIYRTTPDGKILLANPALVKMLGYSNIEELKSRDLLKNGFEPSYPRSLFIEPMEKEGEVKGLESAWKRKDGKIIFIRESARAIRDSNGKIVYYDGVVEDFTEHKQAQEKLNMWANAFEHAEWGVGVSSKDGKTLAMLNPTFAKMHGYAVEELIGQPILNLYPQKSHKEFLNQLKIANNKGHHIFESSHIRKDGTIFPVLMDITVVKDRDGNILYRIVNVQDITDQKNAENIIRESEQSYIGLFNSVSEAIYVQTDDGYFIDVNEGAVKMYGYSRKEFIGRTPEFLSAPGKNNMAEIFELVRRVFATAVPESFEFWGRRKNGEIFPKEVISNKGKYFGKDVIITTARDITERKQAEEARIESEKKYREVVESANEIIYTTDVAGNFVYVNPAGLKRVGYTLDEMQRLNYLDLTLPEHRTRVKRFYYKQFLQKTTSSYIEFPCHVKSGEIVWFGQNGTLIIEDRKAIGFQLIARDITERKRTEEALRDSEERYRSLFDRMMDGVYRSTHEGRFVDVNPAMVRMFGFSSKQEMLNVDIKKELYFAPSERDSLFLDTGQERTEIFRMRRKDGSEIWVEDHGRYIHDEKGNVIFHEGILRDVTERLIAEDKMKKSEEKYRDIVTYAPVGIYQTSVDGKFLTVNKSLVDILGYNNADELIKRNMATDIYYNKEDRKKLIDKYDREFKQSVNNHEIRWKKKDGTPIWILLTVHATKNSSGKTLYYEGFVTDITEHKHAEEALWENEERYRTMVETAHDVVWTLDAKGNVTYINKRGEEISGYKILDLIGENYSLKVVEEDLSKVQAAVTQVFLGKPQSFETRIYDINNKIIILSVNSVPMYEKGKIVGTVNFGRDITEQKRAGETLTILRKAIETSGEAIFLTDREGIFTYVNPGFLSMYGYKNSEVIGKVTPRILKSGLMAPENYKMYWDTLLDGKEVRSEIINKRKNGQLRTIESSANPIFDEKKNIIGFLGIQRDITQRKQSEDKYMLLAHSLKSINECVSITDKDNRLLFVNESFMQTYGYTENELIGQNISIIVSPNNPPGLHKKIFEATLRGGWHGEMLSKRKDGNEFPISLSTSIINDKDGNLLGLIGVAIDITERKKAEEKLQKSEEQFRLISENVADLIAVLDLQGRRIYNSPSYKNILGDPEILRGADSFKEVHPEDREKIRAIFQETIKTGIGQRADYRMIKMDGTIFYIESQESVIRDRDGKISNVVLVSRDVTEKKLLELQILRSQRLESIGTLAGGIAHDLNNVLAPILLAVNFLGDRLKMKPEYAQSMF